MLLELGVAVLEMQRLHVQILLGNGNTRINGVNSCIILRFDDLKLNVDKFSTSCQSFLKSKKNQKIQNFEMKNFENMSTRIPPAEAKWWSILLKI